MKKLLGPLYEDVFAYANVCEVRLAVGCHAQVLTLEGTHRLSTMVSQTMLDNALAVACDYSLYTAAAKMVHGYVPYRCGVRIGLAGRYAEQAQRLHSLCEVSGMVIRVPRRCVGCSEVLPLDKVGTRNVLVVAPPFGGKTTFLRDFATRLGFTRSVVVLDERDELSGGGALDMGECMVLRGAPKALVAEGVVRALNPACVVCDELGDQGEVEMLAHLASSGVQVIASVHGRNRQGLDKPLAAIFDVVVVLRAYPAPGQVIEVAYA